MFVCVFSSFFRNFWCSIGGNYPKYNLASIGKSFVEDYPNSSKLVNWKLCQSVTKIFPQNFACFFSLQQKNLRLKFLLNFAKKTPKSWLLKTWESSIKQSTQQKGEREKGTRWKDPTKYLQNKVHYKWSPLQTENWGQIKYPTISAPQIARSISDKERGEEWMFEKNA